MTPTSKDRALAASIRRLFSHRLDEHDRDFLDHLKFKESWTVEEWERLRGLARDHEACNLKAGKGEA